jgi:tetratricopeptide (TPR) repeat protein
MKKYIQYLLLGFLIACGDTSDKKGNIQTTKDIKYLKPFLQRAFNYDTSNIHKDIRNSLDKMRCDDSLILLANIFLSSKLKRPDVTRLILFYYDSKQSTTKSISFLREFMEYLGKYDSATFYSYKAFKIKNDLRYLDYAIYYTSYYDVNEALIRVNEAINLYPDFAFFYFRKANILVQLKKYEDAIELYNYTEKRFKLKEVYRNRAMAYNLLPNIDASLKDVNIALSLGDTSSETYLIKADALYFYYKYDSALYYANKAFNSIDNIQDAYYIRCKIYKELGKYDLAMNDIETLHKLDSTDIRYYGLKARIYQQTNKINEAKKYYKIAFAKGELTGKKFYDEMIKKK